jgi:hypothetical protein
MRKFVTPREAARESGMSLNATYSALWTERLRGEKRGGRWRIAVDSLNELLQRKRARRVPRS